MKRINNRINHHNPKPLLFTINFRIVIITFIANAPNDRKRPIGYTHPYLIRALSDVNAVTWIAQVFVFPIKLSHKTKNTHRTIIALINPKKRISIHTLFDSFLLNWERKIRIITKDESTTPTREKWYQ